MDVPTRIFIARIDDLSVRQDLLSKEEIGRACSYTRAGGRDQFIAGRSLLRLALSFGNARPPADWLFQVRAGKPTLPGNTGPNFSLSHSGDWVGCALSSGAVCGFDLQHHGKRCVREIAAAYFPPAENEWLGRQRAYDPAFYQLWTLKEAWAKAMGIPLLSALSAALFTPSGTGPAVPGVRAYTAELGSDMTMAWVVAAEAGAWQGWRWNGSGFVSCNPEARPWGPGYHLPTK